MSGSAEPHDGDVVTDEGAGRAGGAGRGSRIAVGLAVTVVALVAGAGLWTFASAGSEDDPPGLAVTGARSGERVGTTLAVYLDVTNDGGADRLLRATSPVADRALVHGTDVAGGMRTSEGLEVPAGATVLLSPGGDHLMLEGVGERLEPGDVFPLDLEFERTGTLQVEVRVVPLESLVEEGPS